VRQQYLVPRTSMKELREAYTGLGAPEPAARGRSALSYKTNRFRLGPDRDQFALPHGRNWRTHAKRCAKTMISSFRSNRNKVLLQTQQVPVVSPQGHWVQY
jgi:hypothetical protein